MYVYILSRARNLYSDCIQPTVAGEGSPNKGAKQSPRSAAGGTRRTKYLKPDSPALELHEVLFAPYLPLLSNQFGGAVYLVSPIW